MRRVDGMANYHCPPEPTIWVASRSDGSSRAQLAAGGSVKVSGVSFGARQDLIRKHAGEKTEDGAEYKQLVAQLILDFKNPHDECNAVAVFFGFDHVGFIPREEAPNWHEVIGDLKAAQLPASCEAEIVGGWQRSCDDEVYYGIRLNAVPKLRTQFAQSKV